MSRLLKILFLAANPKDTDRLRLDEEIRGIDQALRQAEFRDQFEIAQQWAVRVADLQAHLLRYKPDIVHFSGHGSRASEIILEDGDGNSQTVSARALSQLFAVLNDNVCCVVLNACYSEQQAQAIAEHVDFVIGMSKAIGDEAAISFAVAFYQALGYGKDVKTAFGLGRVQIDLENLNEQDTPKFLTRRGNQKIFPDPSIFLPPPQLLSPPEAKDRANLLILLNKVKTFWIEGVLEKSVHNAVLLELGKETLPQAVEHPWEMVLELPDQTNQLLPSNTKIIEVFEKMNRAMLILGEPGSGKTITLLELARDLITRAEADPTQPIPVVFNLSSWTEKRQLLVDWLAFELSTKYQIPRKTARVWLKNNHILPLLDGFDEVTPENRSACVEAINQFGEAFGLPGCVVCSRLEEYTTLPVRLKLNGAICLRWLTLEQVNSYLEAGGRKFSALRSAFLKDRALQGLAQSPLILSILCLTYQELSGDDLSGQLIEPDDHSRKHLFNTYIHRMFLRKGQSERSYSKDQTIHWLSWLAQKMKAHSQTVFLIEDMQSSWLQMRSLNRIYAASFLVIMGLIIGLTFAVYWNVTKDAYGIKEIVKRNQTSLMLVPGLSWVLSALLLFKLYKPNTISRNFYFSRVLTTPMTYWLIWAMIWILTLIWLQTREQASDQYEFLQMLFSSGVIVAIVVGIMGNKRPNFINSIQMAEALGWSWSGAQKGIIWGNMFGLGIWCIWMVMSVAKWEHINGLSDLLANEKFQSYSLLVWIGIMMWAVLFFGLSSRIVKTKTSPNQGVKLSIRNSIMTGLAFGMLLGLTSALIWAVFKKKPHIGLGIGLLSLSGASLWYGGADIIMHCILRFILYFAGHTPRRYVHFLDYATSLIFLQKVGGGYIFIHRLLLEHFAAMGEAKKSS